MISPRNTGHEKGRRQPDLVRVRAAGRPVGYRRGDRTPGLQYQFERQAPAGLGDMNVGDEKNFPMVVNFGYHLLGTRRRV